MRIPPLAADRASSDLYELEVDQSQVRDSPNIHLASFGPPVRLVMAPAVALREEIAVFIPRHGHHESVFSMKGIVLECREASYHHDSRHKVRPFGCAIALMETPTRQSRPQEVFFVELTEERQGLIVGSIEQVRCRKALVDVAAVRQLTQASTKSAHRGFVLASQTV